MLSRLVSDVLWCSEMCDKSVKPEHHQGPVHQDTRMLIFVNERERIWS